MERILGLNSRNGRLESRSSRRNADASADFRLPMSLTRLRKLKQAASGSFRAEPSTLDCKRGGRLIKAPAKGRAQAARALISDLTCSGRCDSMETFAAASITVIEVMIFSPKVPWPRR